MIGGPASTRRRRWRLTAVLLAGCCPWMATPSRPWTLLPSRASHRCGECLLPCVREAGLVQVEEEVYRSCPTTVRVLHADSDCFGLIHRYLHIYCDPLWFNGLSCFSGNEGLACLPMGADAFAALSIYVGPDRCEDASACEAGEYFDGTTCQACPAGASHPQRALRPFTSASITCSQLIELKTICIQV